jgi:predicted transcriptional regulator
MTPAFAELISGSAVASSCDISPEGAVPEKALVQNTVAIIAITVKSTTMLWVMRDFRLVSGSFMA